MIYHAWIRPGTYPSVHRRILISESAVQMPDLIHTVKVSVECSDERWLKLRTCDRREEDCEEPKEDIAGAHCDDYRCV